MTWMYGDVTFEVGDKVQVAREVESLDPNGMGVGSKWVNMWVKGLMDDAIGRVGVIERISERGVELDCYAFEVPLKSLIKLSNTPSAIARQVNLRTHLAYFQAHIDAVQENLDSLRESYIELLREVSKHPPLNGN